MMDARRTRVTDAHLIELDKCHTTVGDLVVYPGACTKGFVPRRVYYLYDVPSGAERGGHAHKQLEQIIVALSGSFHVVLDDGMSQSVLTLSQPTEGLRLPPGMWRELNDFSGGAICLVLASEAYDEGDYIRSFDEFKKWKTELP